MANVQILFDPPDVTFRERLLPPGNLINVNPGPGVVPRVKAAGTGFDHKNNDIGREQIIQPLFDNLRTMPDLRTDLEVNHLT